MQGFDLVVLNMRDRIKKLAGWQEGPIQFNINLD